MVNGHRESRVYYDATREEAITEFREEMDRMYRPSRSKRRTNPDLHSIKQIASNMTEAIHGTATILYSYQTPVAVHVEGIGYFRTAEKFSVTTSKHINKWLESHGARGATVVPQEEIVKLAKKGGQGAGDVRGTTTSYTHPSRASNPKGSSLAGYLPDIHKYGTELTDSHGKGLGWKYDSTVSNFRNRHGDRQYAITLVKGSGRRKQYAGGLYLGDSGNLFRGEVFGILSWVTAGKEAGDMALAEAEHWLQVDADDEDRAEQEDQGEE